MKYALFFALLAAGYVAEAKRQVVSVKPISVATRNATVRSATECSLCVQFMDQFLNELLNAILNGGVLGSCSTLCGSINGTSVEQEVCNVLCDAVGIEAFIKLIQYADLDPIWLCEEVTFCKRTTCTNNCVSIRSFATTGSTFPNSATVNWTITFGVLSADVGVSTIAVTITDLTPDSSGNYFQDSVEAFLPEPTTGFFELILQEPLFGTDDNGNAVPFPVGTYNSTVQYCEGQCGSDHKGSGEILAQKNGANFRVISG